jgi:hypothetical protein
MDEIMGYQISRTFQGAKKESAHDLGLRGQSRFPHAMTCWSFGPERTISEMVH